LSRTRKDKRNTSTTADDYTDTFSYDPMERVTRQATTVGASRTLDFAYDKPGNLTSKLSNVGADLDVTGYTYGTAGKPHRLTTVTIGGVANTLGYDANGNVVRYQKTGDWTWLDYDGQNNVTRITVGTSTDTPTPTARDEFWYTPDGERYLGRESWDDAGTQRTAITTYLGAFEEVRPAANSGYALFQRVQATPTVQWTWRITPGGTTSAFYRLLHRDHLGSVDVVSNSAGAVIAKTTFDPFGGRRASSWGSDITTAERNVLLGVDFEDANSPRGFTDHEQLNRTGFVHMNGRVYDPRIGRFVSPDPIVQAPGFSQSYNRYAYTFNSPLSFTDPSGFMAAFTINFGGRSGDPEGGGSRGPGSGGHGGGFGSPPNNITCDEIAPAELCTFGIDAWWGKLASFEVVLSDGSVNPIVVDAAAGVGDGATLGVSAVLRGLLDIESVDTDSDAYIRGVIFGTGIVVAASAGTGIPATVVRAETAVARSAVNANKLNHVFGSASHRLDDLVRASGGSHEAAYQAVQQAANQALREGRLIAGANGILPGGRSGAVLSVNGVNIQLVGGRVVNGEVQLGSFSRRFLRE
jgi:RHS repeat-associated protein